MLGRRCKFSVALPIVLALCVGPSITFAAATPAVASSPSHDVKPFDAADLAGHGKFIMSLCRDLQNRVWVGTETEGVYCCDPSQEAGSRWKHFTKADGLGDDTAYALCCDKLGRVWAGTLNHGVSVYNGYAWKTYGLLTGPLGSHVTSLAVCPTDGDCWMATEAGLSRYSAASDRWSYYTRREGLASNSISAIAFDRAGNLYVATQCDGLCIGSANGKYRSWRSVSAPPDLATTATGSGLPSNLVNTLLVTNDDAIFAGTDGGLARSTDGGATWIFVRGADWRNKLEGKDVSVRHLTNFTNFGRIA